MREDIPPLPTTPSWRGSELKYRDNFAFVITPLCKPVFPERGRQPVRYSSCCKDYLFFRHVETCDG
jgi:hypothetical protein